MGLRGLSHIHLVYFALFLSSSSIVLAVFLPLTHCQPRAVPLASPTEQPKGLDSRRLVTPYSNEPRRSPAILLLFAAANVCQGSPAFRLLHLAFGLPGTGVRLGGNDCGTYQHGQRTDAGAGAQYAPAVAVPALADRGYVVSRQVAVPDAGTDIEQAVREALGRADLVIVTGGLGPTSDDVTRDLVAQLLGKALQEDSAVLAHIRSFFERRKRYMPERIKVQALVPEGALVLHNPHGTAPGLAMEVRPNPFRGGSQASWLIMLPGPPRELRPMFTDAVAPLLRRVLPLGNGFVCRTLRTTGIGESVMEEKSTAR